MTRFTATFAAIALALVAVGSAHARQDDIDISRLSGSLDQLANDPGMGMYAQAEQARARDAINRLAQASSRERPHDLYLAERRVDLAKAAAQLQVAQVKLTQLDREHDQIQLDNSRRDAEMARRELERQRLQYQLAQEEAARLQQQGQEYSQAADQARAEAEQARKVAAAQSRVANAARREAALAAQAAKAMRSQMQDGSTPPEPAPPAHKKATKKHKNP
jgi:chromosome segregation ATPase